MKGLTKTLVALVLVMTLVATMGMSALAANYSTKTTYQAGNMISVTATATDLKPGEIVTYVAKSEAEVNKETIVYINQDESVDGDDVTFTYTTPVTNIDATMLFGGSGVSTAQPADTDDTNYYTLSVVVNEGTPTEVKVPTQEATAGTVIRKINIAELGISGEITKVLFDREEIENFAVSPSTLMLSTDKINDNGTLYITSSEKTYEEIDCGSVTLDNKDIKVVAKVPASDEFGVVIYKEGTTAPVISANEVVAAEDKSYVILPALGKNAAGIFAVELQGYADFLDGTKFNVAAYALNGETYTMSNIIVATPLGE